MSDAHAALRADVKLLGSLLGRALSEQGGPALLRRVERLRLLAKRAAAAPVDDDSASQELADALARLDAKAAGEVASAFSQFLALSNVAEQHHRVRRRRARRRAAPAFR